ncbi:hypothetical protein BIY22_02475 [Vibrio panuliri]|uniref:diguanylate cyclase n=1 Tax=Vibrio panuliri TaxID=1381081 RepID=A0A1Q9HR69_9VIBR|nr:sensor domain-containing diguanylate cyclase [Vibrio panuliri]OLQ93377.1 hypothetical protein BIY22_02475 [Vibrio panuliri]
MKLKRQHFDCHFLGMLRVALLIIIVFSVLNLAHYYTSLYMFRKNMTDTTLQRTTHQISRVLENVNKSYLYTSKALAQLYGYKLQQNYRPENLVLELQDMKEAYDVKNIGLIDIRHKLYLDSFGRVLYLDLESERDQWVKEFLATPQDYRHYFYDPDMPEYEGLYAFFHDHKIKDSNDNVIGILGLGVSYEEFYKNIQGINQNVTVSFLTESGETRLPKKLKGKSIFSLFPQLPENTLKSSIDKDQIIWGHTDTQSYLLYFHYLEDINRVLLLNIDITDYYNQSRTQHFYSFLLGLALTFIVIVLNFLFSVYQSNQLRHTAFYDSLTRCRNRHYVKVHIEGNRYWRSVKSSEYSMIIFDLDNFKHINDSLGHTAGDHVLRQVADIIRDYLSSSDEFIRWGGDEFIIIIKKNSNQVSNLMVSVLSRIEHETPVSLSMGITDITSEDTFNTAMERADTALYESKKNGRNQLKIR